MTESSKLAVKMPSGSHRKSSVGTKEERRPSSTKLFTTEQPTAMSIEKGKETEEKGTTRNFELILRYVSLALMVCQYVCQVLLTRHASVRPQLPFIKTVAIVLKEAFEALVSLLLFLLLVKPKMPHRALFEPAQNLQMLLPALAYTLKNFLLFVAIDHLDAATFTVSYQLKILTTAIFLVLMLKIRLSPVQWLSLCVLVGGVAMVELSAKWTGGGEEAAAIGLTKSADLHNHRHSSSSANSSTPPPPNDDAQHPHAAELRLFTRSQENFWVGFGSVLGACVLSGYSGVYLEMVVKRPGDSLWLRNFQLCFLSSLFGLAIALLKDFHEMSVHGPMAGFDQLVWAIIVIQVLGGLLVAMVIRYGDNILKAFANAVAILGISLLSWLLFGSHLGWLFTLGTGLVVGAMVLYSLFPAQKEDEAE